MTSDERAWRERGLRDAVRAGDEAAWKTLYQESFAALYAYVLWRFAGLRDAADEVVQDAWLTAVRRIGRFDPARGCFADWLCGIAANLLRNHFRRERVRRNSGAYATRLACLLNRPPTASGPSALPALSPPCRSATRPCCGPSTSMAVPSPTSPRPAARHRKPSNHC